MLKKIIVVAVLLGVPTSMYYINHRLDAMVKPEIVTPAPTDTFDDFYQRKLDEYKKSDSFQVMKKAAEDKFEADKKAEKDKLEANLEKQAEVNILNAIITKVEQKTN